MSKGLFASLYASGQPFALIDTRERRDHVDGHWFGSINIPLSVLRHDISRMIPDTAFPIHLLDWQDRSSRVAAQRLSQLGYENVTLCPSAQPDAFGDGFVRGEFVWSKTFGEVVAHTSELPEITPAEYLADHPDAQLFDVRPRAEYADFTIPGSQSLPNSLMLANMEALKDTQQMALLHCAGRTRSIIGASTLKAAGYSGSFAIFKGGTQAWQLDGHAREHGAQRLFAREADDMRPVQTLLAKWNIPYEHVPPVDLEKFVHTHRAAHLCDVSDDAAKGIPLQYGIIGVSGTNLIQQTDRTIARYHVPVILFDRGSGSRAAFAAYWLDMMGFTVRIAFLETPLRARPSPVHTLEPRGDILSLAQLQSHIDSAGTVYDFRPSHAFCSGNLKRSQWRNIGAMLAQRKGSQASSTPIAVIGNDISHAAETADILNGEGYGIAGIYGWGSETIDPARLTQSTLDTPIDQSALFAGRHHGNMQDSRDYLAWEEELPEQIDQSLHRLWLARLGG